MRATLRTVQRFGMLSGKVLGMAFNRLDLRAGGYGRYGYYLHSGYYASDGDGTAGGRRCRSVATSSLAVLGL
jgi:hypothetical protein